MLDEPRALLRVLRTGRRHGAPLRRRVHGELQRVLVSAFEAVPYYRDLMHRIGYDPRASFAGVDDLQRFPVLTKAMIQEHGSCAFRREDVPTSRCHVDNTSGSTGHPLTVYRSKPARAVQVAKWLRVLFLNGYSVFDKVLSPVAPHRVREGRSPLQRLGLFRRLALDYVACPPGALLDALLEYRPDVVYGLRSHLELVAMEMKRRNVTYRGLKLLVVTGEVIPEAFRELCREGFGIEPTETYGSVELGVMAYDVPDRQGLKLAEDLSFFEFLDRDGAPVKPGEAGRVVVTDLTNEVMPFIRYDQGDLAVFRTVERADGVSERRLVEILGRQNDFIVMPDGSRRGATEAYRLVSGFPGIRQFRIEQETVHRFTVRLAGEAAAMQALQGPIETGFRDRFGPATSVRVESVDALGPDPSGKRRVFLSKVKP